MKGHAHLPSGACRACNVERALPLRPEFCLTLISRTANLADVIEQRQLESASACRQLIMAVRAGGYGKVDFIVRYASWCDVAVVGYASNSNRVVEDYRVAE